MPNTVLLTIPKLLSQVLSIYEVESQPIFAQAGIELFPVGIENSRVDRAKMNQLWQLCIQATGNPELGLVAASLFQPAYLKGIGLAWMVSTNLEEGLRYFADNIQLIDTGMKVELIEQGDELMITYQPKPAMLHEIRPHQCGLQLGMGFFLKMFRLASGKNIPATAVFFRFSIGDSQAIYEEFFQCPVYGDSNYDGISFSKHLLKETLPTSDAELVKINKAAVEKHIQSMGSGKVSSKVIRLVTNLLASGCPTEEIIAYKMNMSQRTLRRKLNSEGVSYSQLLNNLRTALAKQYLLTNSIAVTQIAYQLGYSSPSTFARAFKHQTLVTPLKYREAQIH
ncbi:MAG: AraC family transcriptional regulator ligand-binding domain-containing protein [Oceanospirillaceae bacterium]|nr:AraC family transcriptional regulator ligand-binding domain-containing protein [Oceanospirillaceae bacterium]